VLLNGKNEGIKEEEEEKKGCCEGSFSGRRKGDERCWAVVY